MLQHNAMYSAMDPSCQLVYLTVDIELLLISIIASVLLREIVARPLYSHVSDVWSAKVNVLIVP